MRLFLSFFMAVCLSLASPLSAQAEDGFAKNIALVSESGTVPSEPIRYADGREGSLNDFGGEVLVVTLWQEHCPFCRREMPVLNELAQQMEGQGVRVVALGLDQDMGVIQNYLQRIAPNIEPIMDVDLINGSIFSIEHFGRLSIATPTTFIINKQGNVAATAWGLVDWTGDDAKNYLLGLAAQG